MTTTAVAPARMENADLQAIENLKTARATIKAELRKVIVGQEQVIDEMLICIFTRSHALLVGVPGLAKTLMISTLAQTLHLSFKRIQFTPDLMPSDITGTEVIYQNQATGQREFQFRQGPIFANIILADEINRTPPKTQAAMLEAMQERKVSVAGQDYKLPDPFFVLATQNPIEQEGTYPLPEAQLDRFMFMILVDYPSALEERAIMKMATGVAGAALADPHRAGHPRLAGDGAQDARERARIRLCGKTRPRDAAQDARGPGFLQKVADVGRWPAPA